MTDALIPNNPHAGQALAFSFGDPEPILSGSLIHDYTGVFLDLSGDYYRPPIELLGLVKLMGANAYHGSILHFKKNMLRKWFVPSRWLSGAEFEKLALNYVVTGNCYAQKLTSGFFGQLAQLINQNALPMRRGKQPGQFIKLLDDVKQVEFLHDEIIHLQEPDLRQSIYGIPEYLGGIQSVLLGEESTLFRRKYYLNGAHMGYILVTNDADLDEKTAKLIEQKVKESKGPGNFRSMFINIGRSTSREPVKVIPVGDIATKDEYEIIKAITEREMLAMHRMQPGLSGIIPQNTGGFGDMEKIMHVYHELEITALQLPFLELNDLLGVEAVRFQKPDWKVNPKTAP